MSQEIGEEESQELSRTQRIELALKEIRENKLSHRKAASTYNIPRSTLQDRIYGKVDDVCLKKGPDTILYP